MGCYIMQSQEGLIVTYKTNEQSIHTIELSDTVFKVLHFECIAGCVRNSTVCLCIKVLFLKFLDVLQVLTV